MKTFVFNGVKYRVALRDFPNNGNYDKMAWLFKVGEKSPLMGHACKGAAAISELISGFKTSLKTYNYGL